ncbi:MAG: hypothetical protein U1D55_01650 [Phycisphaerae bacterium]
MSASLWCVGVFFVALLTQEKMTPVAATPQASTQPAPARPVQAAASTSPAEPATGSRAGSTVNTELLNQLLKAERQRSIPPSTLNPKIAAAAEDASLLLEGTMLVDRPGRIVIRGERAEFEFAPDASGKGARSMEILRTQLLEYMEREAAGGVSEFTVSAEVKRYRGRNTIELVKVARRIDHGNLGP